MATANSISGINVPSERTDPGLLVLLAAMPPEQLENLLDKLTSCLPA
jgi:hypothetical protein